ncbi:hypothetical protein F4779DRAFT_592134 [Xylariaceae sp. FL0662B]|nr:hypothetical protein F4779DRAFT_592134 [Xylariaceae sp. FL0662B]
MPSISPGQLAFSAMQFLPVPLLVLNNQLLGLLDSPPGKTQGSLIQRTVSNTVSENWQWYCTRELAVVLYQRTGSNTASELAVILY